MQKIYYAHRTETDEGQEARWQTVLEHLNGTAALCARFAAAFGAEDQGRLAGLAHDIGKYSAAFQRRLEGSAERVDHSTAGAAECCKLNLASAAFAVAGHHGGLPDGGGQADPGSAAGVFRLAGGNVFHQDALLLSGRCRFPGHGDIYGGKRTGAGRRRSHGGAGG